MSVGLAAPASAAAWEDDLVVRDTYYVPTQDRYAGPAPPVVGHEDEAHRLLRGLLDIDDSGPEPRGSVHAPHATNAARTVLSSAPASVSTYDLYPQLQAARTAHPAYRGRMENRIHQHDRPRCSLGA